ncbi:MAG: oligosaccharide flippase family protein [Actinomycetia bacterium]|nr:oligosaccharide flippase family protein [Actinomycetes bacterium]
MPTGQGTGEGPARFWRDTLWLNAGALAAGLGNVLYHVVVARLLGPAAYGVLAGLGTVVTLLELPVAAVAVVFTRAGESPRTFGRTAALALALGALLGLAAAAAAGRLAAVFRLPVGLLRLAGLAVVPAFLYGVAVGVLQWAGRFVPVGVLLALDAVSRAGGAGITALAGWGLTGLVALMPVLTAAVTGFAVVLARRALGRAAGEGRIRHGGLGRAGWVGLMITVMTTADVLVVKHALPPVAAGLYSGLATLGRAPAYFSGAIGAVLLSTAQRDPARGPAYLARALALTAALGLAGLAVYAAAGPPIVRLTLGTAFFPLLPYVVGFTAAMGVQGLVVVLLYYEAAAGGRLLVGLATAGTVAWLAALWTVGSLSALVHRSVGIWGLTVLAMGLGAVRHRKPPLPGGPGTRLPGAKPQERVGR